MPSRRAYGHAELVERDVELEHVDRRLAEEAERAAVGVVVDELVAPRRAEIPRPSATRWRLQPRVGDRDVRVEPRAGRGHRVDRHLRIVRRARSPRGSRRPAASTAASRSGLVGPQFEPRCCRSSGRRPVVGVVRSPRRPAAAAGRARTAVEVLRPSVNVWPSSFEPTTLPFTSSSEPFALSENAPCRDAGDDERVRDPEQHGEDDHHHDGGQELASHHFTPRAVTMHVDDLDADERGDDPAERRRSGGCGAAAAPRRTARTSRRATRAGSATR